MPEWESYVRGNLRLCGVRPECEAEIVEDIARQLEDAYLDARSGGRNEADALAQAKQHVADWDAFSRQLRFRPGDAPAMYPESNSFVGVRIRSEPSKTWTRLPTTSRSMAAFHVQRSGLTR